MNRRIDPEQTGPVYWPHIWRTLRVQGACKPVPGWPWSNMRGEWTEDAGYCLDRFSTRAELADQHSDRP